MGQANAVRPISIEGSLFSAFVYASVTIDKSLHASACLALMAVLACV